MKAKLKKKESKIKKKQHEEADDSARKEAPTPLNPL